MSTESSLVRLELRWKAKRNALAPAVMAAGITLDRLDEAGYILGAGSKVATASSCVCADAASSVVSIHAWFIGAGAWDAAVEESESSEDGVFSIDDFCLVSRLPKVIDHTKGAHKPYPSCKASLASKPRLRLCATPDTRCPALLAEDGGVVAQWKLPLSGLTRTRLHEWNVHARLVAALMGTPGSKGLYTTWAKRELSVATSALAKEAGALAALVSDEAGVRVVAKRPLFDLAAP